MPLADPMAQAQPGCFNSVVDYNPKEVLRQVQ